MGGPVFATLSKRSEEEASIMVFFYIEAKRTRAIVQKFFLKRSEHIYVKKLNIEAK